MRRPLLPLLAALTLLCAVPAAAAPRGGVDHLEPAMVERARVTMDALGKQYGTTVGHGDLYWFAQRLAVPVGTHVNPGDLARLVGVAEARVAAATRTGGTAAAYAALAPLFDPFGLRYGTTVNEGDAAKLGREVGIPTTWPPSAADAARIGVRAAARAAEPHPVVLTWRGIDLVLPSTGVELIAWHQSNNEGARNTTAVGDAVPFVVMEGRGRLSGARSAADVVVSPGVDIVAPVTGRVVRSGTYTLYCRYSDDYLVVEPDGHPGIEVKMLHIDGVRVRAGERVVAGVTVVAGGPTPLPFASQVDDLSHWRDWPHTHVEVVDTSIPDRPNPGSGGC